MNFNRVLHYKLSILGYPYFWKHPYLQWINRKQQLYKHELSLSRSVQLGFNHLHRVCDDLRLRPDCSTRGSGEAQDCHLPTGGIGGKLQLKQNRVFVTFFGMVSEFTWPLWNGCWWPGTGGSKGHDLNHLEFQNMQKDDRDFWTVTVTQISITKFQKCFSILSFRLSCKEDLSTFGEILGYPARKTSPGPASPKNSPGPHSAIKTPCDSTTAWPWWIITWGNGVVAVAVFQALTI